MKTAKLRNWRQVTNSKGYEGESIEIKCKRITEEKEPITDGAPIIYTPKEKGVIPAYDIRTDRWLIAQEAMDAVNRERIAKNTSPSKETDKKDNVTDQTAN